MAGFKNGSLSLKRKDTSATSDIGFTNLNFSSDNVAYIVDDYGIKRPVTPISTGAINLPQETRLTNSVYIPSFEINIFDNPSFQGVIHRKIVPEATLNITSGGINQYVVATWNDGFPVMSVISDKSLINQSNVVACYLFWNINGIIHGMSFHNKGVGLANKVDIALISTEPYKRSLEGGLSLLEDGARHVLVTSAVVYAGVTPYDISYYNSTTDTFTEVYHTSGVWTFNTTSGIYDNTKYDNGTNLVSAGANKYLVRWMFRAIGDEKEILMVYGTDQYNTSDAAKLETYPAVPNVVLNHCMYVGRIIIQYGASSGIIESPFAITIGSGGISNHNDLLNIQGGNVALSEYYHLPYTTYSYISGASADVQGQINSLKNITTPGTWIVSAGNGLTGGGYISASPTLSLQNINSNGVYTKVSVDTYGRVTTGTTLTSGDIPQLPITKIGSGIIDNNEFEYLNGVSANIQNQLTSISANIKDSLVGFLPISGGTLTGNLSGLGISANTFYNSQYSGNLVLISDANKNIGESVISITTLNYLDGTSANIQNQFNNLSALDSQKALKTTTITAGTMLSGGGDLSTNRTISHQTVGIAGTYSNIVTNSTGHVTSARNLVAGDMPSGIDASKIADGSIDNNEFKFLNGVTSNIQNQIDLKLAKNATIQQGTGIIISNSFLSASPIISLSQFGTSGNYDIVQTDAYGRVVSGRAQTSADIPQIPATKIGSGIISNSEFEYLDTVSANIQTQLNSKTNTTNLTAYQTRSEKGSSLGYAALDSNSKIYTSSVPDFILGQLRYVGTWNANTNSPVLPAPSSVSGNFYIVSVSGTTIPNGLNPNTSATIFPTGVKWDVGDWIVSDGIYWDKVDNSDAIVSWNGRLGAIVPIDGDYNAKQITNTPSGNITATNVQNAINELDSEKVPTSRTVNTGVGLTGGGTLTADRTISLSPFGTSGNYDIVQTDTYGRVISGRPQTSADIPQIPATKIGSGNISNQEFEYLDGISANIQTQFNNISALDSQKALKTITITAGTGLTGGGDLSTNRTLSLSTTGTSGTYTKVTTDTYGRVTAGTTLTSGDIPTIPVSKIQDSSTDRFVSDTQIGQWSSNYTTVNSNSADWETAAANTHTHLNQSNLDLVNQNLNTSASPTFAGLTVGNVSNTEIGYLDGISANIQTQFNNISALDSQKALKTITITAGTGLTGGGDLSTNRTISLSTTGTSGTYTKVTTDAYGRVTTGTTLTSADIPTIPVSKIQDSSTDRFVSDAQIGQWSSNYTTVNSNSANWNTAYIWGNHAVAGYASSSHNHTLDSLSNVTITSNAAGKILKWSGTAWVNSTLSEAGIQSSLGYTPVNKDGDTGIGNLVGLSGARTIWSKDILPTTSENTNYYNAPIVVQREATSGNTYAAGVGFHNNGVNAAFLYYSPESSYFKYNRNNGAIVTIWDSENLTNLNQLTNGPGYITSAGNAATATKLATARTLTIGNTGKTFDGTTNVSWSLAEIGAAASSHNHTLNSLSNVTITSNVSGEILKWNGTSWVNNTLSEAGIQPAGSYLTGNQTITLSGDVSGSGSTLISVTNKKIDVTQNEDANGDYPLVWENGSRVLYKTDTKLLFNPYTGIIKSQGFDGNATTSSKLLSARTITIGSTGKTFDGTANVSWTLAEIGAQPTGSYQLSRSVNIHNPNLGAGYIKFATITIPGGILTTYNAKWAFDGREINGNLGRRLILTFSVRRESNNSFDARLYCTETGNTLSDTISVRTNDGITWDFYVDATSGGYCTYYTVTPEYNSMPGVSNTFIASASMPTYSTVIEASRYGYAHRLVNARTLTIGSTGKSFDGSANVTWSLAEIGAPASADVNLGTVLYGSGDPFTNRSGYAANGGVRSAYGIGPFSTGNVWYNMVDVRHGNALNSGDIYGGELVWGMNDFQTRLAFRSRGYNGTPTAWTEVWTNANLTNLNQLTNGPGYITSAGNAATATKLATARTLTIGSTGKSFDGSTNVSWSLSEIGNNLGLINQNLNTSASPTFAGLSVGNVSNTEIGYLVTVSANIQTQFNNLSARTSPYQNWNAVYTTVNSNSADWELNNIKFRFNQSLGYSRLVTFTLKTQGDTEGIRLAVNGFVMDNPRKGTFDVYFGATQINPMTSAAAIPTLTIDENDNELWSFGYTIDGDTISAKTYTLWAFNPQHYSYLAGSCLSKTKSDTLIYVLDIPQASTPSGYMNAGFSNKRINSLRLDSFVGGKVLVSSPTNEIVELTTITSAELNYLDGTSANIQTQLNTKQLSLGYTPVNKAGDTMAGNLNINGNLTANNLVLPPNSSIIYDTSAIPPYRIRQEMADNDHWSIYGEGTSNAGRLILEVGDDLDETVYIRKRRTNSPYTVRTYKIWSEENFSATNISNWNTAYANTHTHLNQSKLDLVDQNLNTSASPSFAKINITSDGTGENIRVGNDLWIGDINFESTALLKGAINSETAYLKFTSDGPKVGYDGTDFSIINGGGSSSLLLGGGSNLSSALVLRGTMGSTIVFNSGNDDFRINGSTGGDGVFEIESYNSGSYIDTPVTIGKAATSNIDLTRNVNLPAARMGVFTIPSYPYTLSQGSYYYVKPKIDTTVGTVGRIINLPASPSEGCSFMIFGRNASSTQTAYVPVISGNGKQIVYTLSNSENHSTYNSCDLTGNTIYTYDGTYWYAFGAGDRYHS